MSRLGGAAAVAPLVADMSSEVIILQVLFHFHTTNSHTRELLYISRLQISSIIIVYLLTLLREFPNYSQKK